MNIQEMREGQIITFYSYKGGTGRTMALANISVITAQFSNIKSNKILLIDWDLEAPGMHRFFFNYFRYAKEEEIYSGPGLIDFFIHAAEVLKQSYGDRTLSEEDTRKLLSDLMPGFLSTYVANTSFPNFQILKAGAFNDSYTENISRFKWEEFFNRAPAFFRIFSELLKKEFDYVFIDSRTGENDTSGICTMLMPDKLCLVFTPNRQSLDGVKKMARKSLSYRLTSSDMRPLMIYPIPSRVELAEKDLRDQWRKGIPEKKLIGFQPTFENLFNEYYSTVKCNLTGYFDEVQIHHEPKYSYGEEMAVMNETYTDRLSLTKVYTSIQKKIISDAPFWGEGEGIKIYFSYSRKDQKLVDELSRELAGENYTIVSSNEIPSGEDQFRSIESRVLSADVFIPIVSNYYQTDSQFSSLEVYTFLEKKPANSFSLVIPVFGNKELASNNSFGLQRFAGIFLDKIPVSRSKRNAAIAKEIINGITRYEASSLPVTNTMAKVAEVKEAEPDEQLNTMEDYA